MLPIVDLPPPLPPPAALEILADTRYAFCFVDAGISDEDLMDFSEIDIQKNLDLNELGQFHELEGKIAVFIAEIGSNSSEVSERAAKRGGAIKVRIIFN